MTGRIRAGQSTVRRRMVSARIARRWGTRDQSVTTVTGPTVWSGGCRALLPGFRAGLVRTDAGDHLADPLRRLADCRGDVPQRVPLVARLDDELLEERLASFNLLRLPLELTH